jgi:nucleoid-associated protein YgaU
MTRETKIGLLVGLAFIIVIGILLSDHMTSTTQPPQAALVDAAANVRESQTSPAPVNPGPAPVTSVPPITPTNTVPTQVELRPPPAPPANSIPPVVMIGPANQQPAPPIAIRQDGSLTTQPPTAVGPTVATGDVAVPPSDDPSALEQWARTALPTTPAQPQPPVTPVTPATPKREYVAQAGDSLSRMASKLLGSNTKANRDAIVKLNPTLQKNPDIVVEGRKYTIPPSAAPTQTVAMTPATPAAPVTPVSTVGPTGIPDTVAVNSRGSRPAVPVTQLVDPIPAAAPAAGGGMWYVVKENDNLWKIAADQLGSGNAWLQIKELNKDILKGGETVQPNMRLRIPGKPLASAS